MVSQSVFKNYCDFPLNEFLIYIGEFLTLNFGSSLNM
jgi:hypothetical protein